MLHLPAWKSNPLPATHAANHSPLQHNTCPVCRKGLDGKDPPENTQPEIPADSPLLTNPVVQREYQEEDFD